MTDTDTATATATATATTRTTTDTTTSETASASGVTVVGTGAISALGPTARHLWEGARRGQVGIGPVQALSMDGLDTKVGGEVTDPVEPRRGYLAPEGFRERAIELALVAADEALATLPEGLVAAERFGVVLGTCNAGLLSGREWLRAVRDGETPDPRLALLVTPQALAESVGAAFGLRGPVLAVNTACASGANAIGLAADLLRAGRADAVLAGGSDAFSDVCFAGFHALQSLSPEPAAPYDAGRQGLSLGEGSGMVLLVRSDFAREHGLTGLADVAGYGLSADGFHSTAPQPEGKGAARAITSALRLSGVTPEEIGYVNGHGTGTPKNDPAETNAIRLALGEAEAARTPVSSTKSMIGHMLGAAGAAEAIVTAHALNEQLAPPTAGYTTPDPECPLDYIPGAARPLDSGAALSNNFAFGGANASLVLTRSADAHRPPAPDTDRVVITGIGLLSPAGGSAAEVWSAYTRGQVPVTVADGVRRSAVDFDPEPYLTKRQRRRMDRLAQFGIAATSKALADAGVEPGSPEAEAIGIVFGTGTGPMEAMQKFTDPLLAEGPAAADPSVFPNTVYNQAAGQIAIHLGLRGPTSTLSVGHATGAATLAYTADLLAAGHADALVCTVTDTLTEQVGRAYAAVGAASTRADDEPADGKFTLAEGSVAVVLERRSAAIARGATILGEILGHGMASDASRARRWDARGRGLERAMRAALDDAGLAPTGVGAVWLAAAGLSTADAAENLAVSRLFGPHPVPALHAPKTVLGEPMGVGGALTLALALHQGRFGGGLPVLLNSSSLGGSHVSVAVRCGADSPRTTTTHDVSDVSDVSGENR
ncbi:beta-ketoacyl-[acyl-carrier-protein] synthase family protein [Streptomyces apocyni]|uniref:beta-ketoacyl-[acyl-carrier-protein] synthase family protein n=1 Tax=Streptomyces apocyni TaxID=2654677 RepID=UPI0012EAE5A8|nr:beta-ketoacyl-[acyl-carrier-protein] synthase family protein [Streptomyces apocyni]